MTSTIDGLVSGLDTTSLINQLMTAESQPQTNLKTQLTSEQAAQTAYRSINTKMSALMSAAQALTTPGALDLVKATSSSDSVSATASSVARQGALSFTVQQTAAAQVDLSGDIAGTSATVVPAGGSLTFTVGAVNGSAGTTTTITPTDGSLAGVVAAINKTPGLGITAAAVNMGNGNYRLQLSSSKTGAANGFTVSGFTAGVQSALATPQVAARDAQIALGGDTTALVSSSSNTFDQVVPGLTFTLKDGVTTASGTTPGQSVTISMATDVSGASDKVKAMVDAANAALDEIGNQTKYDSSTQKASPLTADYGVRRLQQQILSAVSYSIGGGTNADIGVQLTKDGHLSFDASKFSDEYAKNPDLLKQLVGVSGTSSSSTTSLYSASQRTQPGAYQVRVDGWSATGDVQGAIGYTAADGTTQWSTTTGGGSMLTVTDTNGPAQGLTVDMTGAPTGTTSLSVFAGLAQALANVASGATDTSTGSLTNAINSRQNTIDQLNTNISDWDVRLSARKDALQQQYANMETALGKLQSQSSWLSQQLSSMS